MFRALLCTDTASGTFCLIDICDIIYHMNRIFRTVLLTETASDTSHGARLHDVLSFILRTALHNMFRLIRYELDQVLRAGVDTLTARLAGLSTSAMPSTIWIASNGHAFTQLP